MSFLAWRAAIMKRTTLMPPEVEPAQPPTSITASSTIWTKYGHCNVSVTMNPVVVISVIV